MLNNLLLIRGIGWTECRQCDSESRSLSQRSRMSHRWPLFAVRKRVSKQATPQDDDFCNDLLFMQIHGVEFAATATPSCLYYPHHMTRLSALVDVTPDGKALPTCNLTSSCLLRRTSEPGWRACSRKIYTFLPTGPSQRGTLSCYSHWGNLGPAL
jgi:hypothetical protein